MTATTNTHANRVMNSNWMTAAEAAEYLRVKPRSIQLWTRQGKLKGHPVSGCKRHRWLYRREDLDAALLAKPVISSQPPAVLNERKVK